MRVYWTGTRVVMLVVWESISDQHLTVLLAKREHDLGRPGRNFEMYPAILY